MLAVLLAMVIIAIYLAPKSNAVNQPARRWVKVGCLKPDASSAGIYLRCTLKRADAVKVTLSTNAYIAVNTTLKCPHYYPRTIVSGGPSGGGTLTISKLTHPGLYAVMHASATCTIHFIVVPVNRVTGWRGKIIAVRQLQRPASL
jgi:hypothetical protein